MKPLIAVITVALTLVAQQSQPSGKESSMPHRGTGPFDVKIAALPPNNQDDKSLEVASQSTSSSMATSKPPAKA